MKTMRKFWNFSETENGENILRLDGEIASESWWGDEVTPKLFMSDLAGFAGKDITVWINSPGGDVVAGSQIYTALKEHNGQVTVKIDGIAASAASVIAMAGDFVYMSPTSLLMIHDPMTIAMGNETDMAQAINILRECKESIINAYALKTGISRSKVSRLMSDETWMNAKKAVELGFADKILYTDNKPETETVLDSYLFGRRVVFNSLLSKLPKAQPPVPVPEDNSYINEIENLKLEFEII
ncbi:MAG: ATP-dependent Clp protease proteolytic subunit 1 [Firmicutes bacterium ADurb.Bin193]|nr:MAG: ATP-dependent Clp protease proteolytic subunit 1 [Firmicutes bacterium ADurb.Bin193]